MTCARCREVLTDSKVKVEENGKKAVFANASRAVFSRVRVDGCLVNGAVSADFLVAKADVGHVIVELKGKDVVHAYEQILATAKSLKACSQRPVRIAGLIVCTEYPRGIARSAQRLRDQFAREFKGPIHVVASNNEYVIEKVLAFNGPL